LKSLGNDASYSCEEIDPTIISGNAYSVHHQISILDSQIKQSKESLEKLKERQDSLMTEIKEWSDQRKVEEQQASNQKLQLEECIREKAKIDQEMEEKEQEYNQQLDRMRKDLENIKEIIIEKKDNEDGKYSIRFLYYLHTLLFLSTIFIRKRNRKSQRIKIKYLLKTLNK